MYQQNNQEPTLKIKQFYEGKNILITGTTGFVGKVLLEKILRSIPKIGQIYLMIRGKRNQTPKDRVKEILDTECFSRCRKIMGAEEFMAFAFKKIHPIQGDLIQDGCGLSELDRRTIIENVHIIINSAASVSFDDSLHDSINMNYMGSMRMFDLGKSTKNLVAYCHVSTAYVNCNLPYDSMIEEEIYNKDQDVERLISKYINMSPLEIREKQTEILNGYPNTYTFTKAMTERSILKKRGDMPCCILRPAMVGCSMKEPFPGWVDTIAAMGAPMFFGGIGVYGYALTPRGNGADAIDVVTVDQCCNSILIATSHCAFHPEKLHVYNHTSSHVNPMSLKTYCDEVNKFYKYHPSDMQALKPGIGLSRTRENRNFQVQLTQLIPAQAMLLFNSIPGIGNKKTHQNISKLYNLMKKLQEIRDKFEPFEVGHWFYKNEKMNDLLRQMSPEEQIEFDCDVRNINWPEYLQSYCMGTQIYAVFQDNVKEHHGLTQILRKNKEPFEDIYDTLKPRDIVQNNSMSFENNIVNEKRFYNYVEQIVRDKIALNQVKLSDYEGTSEEKMFKLLQKRQYRYDETKIRNEIQRMRSQITKVAVQSLYHMLHKVGNHISTGVYVDLKALDRVKMLSNDSQNRIIFVPLNRSFTDLLLFQYINFMHGVNIGFTFGSLEDTPRMSSMLKYIAYTGVILPQRTKNYDHSISYVNQMLFQDIVAKNGITTVYQNSFRARSGKLSNPSKHDDAIEWILRSHQNLKLSNVKFKIVPVSINYERVFDESLLASEIISGEFENLTAFGLFKKIITMPKNKLGKVFVKYAEPIDLDSYIDKNKNEFPRFHDMALKLTKDLIIYQKEDQPITKNAILSSILLFHQKPTITMKKIRSNSQQLCGMVKLKNSHTYMSNTPSDNDIREMCKQFGLKIIGQADKNPRVVLKYQNENKMHLNLGFYTNSMAQNFFDESIIAHALQFHYLNTDSNSFKKKDLFDTVQLIQSIFKGEFISMQEMTFQELESYLRMVSNRIHFIQIEGEDVNIKRMSKETMNQLKYFRELIQNLIDCYYVVLIAINEVMEKGIFFQLNQLVSNLHTSIQEMYYQGSVRFLNSCLIETINNAFERYDKLGIIKIENFEQVSEEGPAVIYFKAPIGRKAKLDKFLNILESMSSCQNNPEKAKIVEVDVLNAVMKSTGKLMPKL